MKKVILLICNLFLLQTISFAQNNPGFNYQAVARNASGQVMENEQLNLRFSIILDHSGTGNGTIIYRESHQLTTNQFGLFSTVIGQGNTLIGDFQKIDWAQMNLFLQVDIDLELNQNYTFMGKTRILPVPVALHAMSADHVDDADADPTNELQFLQYDSLTNTLQLTGANSIQLPKIRTEIDADSDPQNELQQLSLLGTILSINQGNSIDLNVLDKADADADPTNELQTITFDSANNILLLSTNGGSVDLSKLAESGQGTTVQTLTLNGKTLEISDGNSVDLDTLSSPWERKSGFIQYDHGDVQVDHIYAETGDSLTQMNAEGIAVIDDQKIAKLSPNALQFDFIQNTGDYAYYGQDSLSFGRNITTLLPVFAEIDALGAEFYNFQARTYHEAGVSEYNFGQDSLAITAFGLVNRGLSGNTPYERFRLEANNFTMYNNQRFKSYELITSDTDLAAHFKMYPGNGLPAYFELGPDPFDALNPQVSLNYNGVLAARMTTEVGGYGRLNLFDPIGFAAVELSALNGIYYQDKQGYGFSIGPTGLNQRQELFINNGDLIMYDSSSNKKWQWLPNRLDALTNKSGELGLSMGISEQDQSYLNIYNGDLFIHPINLPEGPNNISLPTTRLTSDAKIYLNNPNTFGNGLEMSHDGFKIFDPNNFFSTNPIVWISTSSTAQGGGIFHLRRNSGAKGIYSYIDNDTNEALQQIYNGKYELYDNGATKKSSLEITNNAGQLNLYGANGLANVQIGTFDFPDRGYISLENENDVTTLQLSSSAYGGSTALSTNTGQLKMNQYITSDLASRQEFYGANGSLNTAIGANPFAASRGSVTVYDENGNIRAGMVVNTVGQGVLFADTKNFRMDHPKDRNKEIWYVSLEGPEAGAYERGTSTLENGERFISYPEHFQLIASTNTATVQVTPLSAESTGLAVVKKTAEGFYVKELFQGTGTYDFDWEVKCVRKGYEDFQVIRDKKSHRSSKF